MCCCVFEHRITAKAYYEIFWSRQRVERTRLSESTHTTGRGTTVSLLPVDTKPPHMYTTVRMSAITHTHTQDKMKPADE